MSHFIGRAWVWKKDGKVFFTCPECRLEHKMSAKNLVQDKMSASGYSVKLEAEDGRSITIPLSEAAKLAPYLLESLPSALN